MKRKHNSLRIMAIVLALVWGFLALQTTALAATKTKKRSKKEIVNILTQGLQTMQKGIPASLQPYYFGCQNYLQIWGRYDPEKDAGVAYKVKYFYPQAWLAIESKFLSAVKKNGFTQNREYTSPETSIWGNGSFHGENVKEQLLYIDLGSSGSRSILEMEAPETALLQNKHVPSILRPFVELRSTDWYISELSSGPGFYDYSYEMNYFCIEMRLKHILWEDDEPSPYETQDEVIYSFYELLLSQNFNDISYITSNLDDIDLESTNENGDFVIIRTYPDYIKIYYRVGDIIITENDFPLVQSMN